MVTSPERFLPGPDTSPMATMTTDLPAMVTAADVARLIHSSERTVQRLAAGRVIPHHRIGHLLRFTTEDVEAILNGSLVAPATDAPSPIGDHS